MSRRSKQTFLQRWLRGTWKDHFIIRELWIKTTMRYHFTLVRMVTRLCNLCNQMRTQIRSMHFEISIATWQITFYVFSSNIKILSHVFSFFCFCHFIFLAVDFLNCTFQKNCLQWIEKKNRYSVVDHLRSTGSSSVSKREQHRVWILEVRLIVGQDSILGWCLSWPWKSVYPSWWWGGSRLGLRIVASSIKDSTQSPKRDPLEWETI